MTRGLLWLPLLVVFIGLAWAGWNEYQKLEAYQQWARQFERAKYDIYAALGQTGKQLTWGQPTRKGVINCQSFSLEQVQGIWLEVDHHQVDIANPPESGRQIALLFELAAPAPAVRVPFTDLALAIQWGTYLQQAWQPQTPKVEG